MRIPIARKYARAVSGAGREDIAALARQYGPDGIPRAWRILGSRAAAEDVQQQLFLRLIESPPRDVTSWPAYLTAVGHAAGHRSPAAAAALAIAGSAVERRDRRRFARRRSPNAQEAGRFMRAALARLKPRDAACFVMRHLHGLSPGEIGRALGISENHVSVSVHRARQALEAMHEKEQLR